MFMNLKQVTVYELEDFNKRKFYSFVKNEGFMGVKRQYIRDLDDDNLRRYMGL